MATIVRVKRRRDVDPLEVLHLASKRQKQSQDESASTSSATSSSSFKFAGTVDSKTTGVSQKVREAIRKDKLEREYKRHQADIVGQVHTRNRQQSRESSMQNRLTVTAKHRALALDNLDEVSNDDNSNRDKQGSDIPNPQTDEFQDGNSDRICKLCGKPINKKLDSDSCDCKKDKQELDDKENKSDSTSEDVKGAEGGSDISKNTQHMNGNSNESATGQSTSKDKREKSSTEVNGHSEDRMFCLVDMEMDGVPSYESLLQASSQDQITCNGQAMIRETVSEQRRDDDYVYDIYYTNDSSFDFRLFENDLTFEATRLEAFDADFVDDEFVYVDDEDDENAESNWRNDYPDEDPGFLDNVATDYVYPNDMVELGQYDPEDTNQLADWMSWRMNLEDGEDLSSDDDAVDHYETKGSSYEAYYRKVKTDLEEDSDSND